MRKTSSAPCTLQVGERESTLGRSALWQLSLSLGVTESPAGEKKSLWDVLGEADAAMFEVKRAKRSKEGGPVAER